MDMKYSFLLVACAMVLGVNLFVDFCKNNAENYTSYSFAQIQNNFSLLINNQICNNGFNPYKKKKC